MLKSLVILISIAACGSFACASPQAMRWVASINTQTTSKKDVLAKLKVIQDQQIQESTDLENAIRKQLNETVQLNLSGDDLAIAGRRTNLVTKKIDELNKRRTELNARREIVDRLIFQIDSKWDGKSKLQDFLVATFLDMASTDLADGRDNRLWKEFTFLSMVMREVPEASDNVVSIFEGYLKFSSVLDPKSPSDFIASRNYTNGLESQQAHGSMRDSAGDKLPGAPSSNKELPQVIRATIAKDMVPQPPPPDTALSVGAKTSDAAGPAASAASTVSGSTTSVTSAPLPMSTPPVQSTPAPAPHVAAQKTKIEKAQALTGQATMPAITGGSADSPRVLDQRDQKIEELREKSSSTN